MARPKIANEVIIEIKERRKEGLTLDQIQDRMQDDRDTGRVLSSMPGRNTIAKYAKQYDALPPEIKDLDNDFEWHSLKAYDLPWEAGSYLLEMWNLLREGSMGEHYLSPRKAGGLPANVQSLEELTREDKRSKLLLTARQARWCWWIHLAVPDVEDKVDVWYLAQRFVNREIATVFLNTPLYFADLEAHLSCKPWSSQEKKQTYIEAVEEGDIPALQRGSQLFGVPDVGQHRIFAHFADDLLMQPYLLRSQQHATIRRVTELS